MLTLGAVGSAGREPWVGSLEHNWIASRPRPVGSGRSPRREPVDSGLGSPSSWLSLQSSRLDARRRWIPAGADGSRSLAPAGPGDRRRAPRRDRRSAAGPPDRPRREGSAAPRSRSHPALRGRGRGPRKRNASWWRARAARAVQRAPGCRAGRRCARRPARSAERAHAAAQHQDCRRGVDHLASRASPVVFIELGQGRPGRRWP